MAQYDHDGDIITYSPEDKVAIAEEIIFIDMELAGPCAEGVRCELTRQRCQLWPNWRALFAHVERGINMRYSYDITPRAYERGGG